MPLLYSNLLTKQCQECELRATSAKRTKTERGELQPPQNVVASANGHPATAGHVGSLLNAPLPNNGAPRREDSTAQPHYLTNGYQGTNGAHVHPGYHHQHQAPPRGHGVSPPSSHSLSSPQRGQIHPLPAAPMYTHPPSQYALSGHRPIQPAHTQGALLQDYHHQHSYAHHQGQALQEGGLPSIRHLQAPSQVLHQGYSAYAGDPSPNAPRYRFEEYPPSRSSGAETQYHSVPSPERPLFGNYRPS